MAESVPLERINILVLASSKSLNRSTNTQTVTHTYDKHTLPFFFSHSESKVIRHQQFVLRPHRSRGILSATPNHLSVRCRPPLTSL